MPPAPTPTYPHVFIQDQLAAIRQHSTGQKRVTMLGAGILPAASRLVPRQRSGRNPPASPQH
ncbi:hypothetical protein [Thermoleptolyngbya sp.]